MRIVSKKYRCVNQRIKRSRVANAVVTRTWWRMEKEI